MLNAKILAVKIRLDVVRMIGKSGQTGHLGGSCSSADFVAALYSGIMSFNPAKPEWRGRDKFIYSKGHAAIAQYAAMAEVGFFPVEELKTVKTLGSRLQGHPDRMKTPGVEAGTGSLGQGLSIANGMALALRLDRSSGSVYCVMGDGEMNEGQIWEAAMSAAHFRLENVIGIVDKNRLQATGFCDDRMKSEPLADKWRSFGWNVIEIDGHDMKQIFAAFSEAKMNTGNPSVIIANTVKGKGVSFAENNAAFHNGALSEEHYALAIKELSDELESLLREKKQLEVPAQKRS